MSFYYPVAYYANPNEILISIIVDMVNTMIGMGLTS